MSALPPDLAALPALTVRQPWATSIVHFGKTVENRRWIGIYLKAQLSVVRAAGNRFLIHAGKGMDEDDILGWRDHIAQRPQCRPSPEMMKAAGVERIRDLPRGGIIGVATVAEWVTTHESPWFVGPGALVLTNVQSLAFIPCRGLQGFFRPTLEDGSLKLF